MRLSTFVATLAWASFFAMLWLILLGIAGGWTWIGGLVFCLILAVVVAMFRDSATHRQATMLVRGGKE